MEPQNKACDALLTHRVENKMRGSKVNFIINWIHVAVLKPRDDVVRAPVIPEAVKNRKKYDTNDSDRRKLARDIEAEEGDAGVDNIDLERQFLFLSLVSRSDFFICFVEDCILANSEWKMDTIPEIMDGKNVADFIDPEIAEKLEALEHEEEKLQAKGIYDSVRNRASFSSLVLSIQIIDRRLLFPPV